jgi:Raf kinase inhibitor-like YbhB/YbcL family protein
MPSIHVVLAPALLSGLVLVSACATAQPPAQDILLESATMTSGQTMPRLYTPDGRNLSPPITWHNLPANTRAIAVVCADFGAGMPPPWVHWIIYNIPATAKGLPAGLPILPETPLPDELSGAIQGLNGWRRPYYRGPAPPVGTPHIYHFTIYALDEDLDLEPGLDRDELLRAMDRHIIGQGELAPIYQRFAN